MNIPDNWVVLKIKAPTETFYKVLAGWSGGYLDGDSWRLNSGIEEVQEEADYYDFIGSSGSVYRCRKNSECVRMNIAGVLKQLEDTGNIEITSVEEVLDEIKKVVTGGI